MDANQKTGSLMGSFVKQSPYDYGAVGASATDQVLGSRGAQGDYIDSLVISVNTVATATVSIKDGAASIPILTGAATVVPGVYTVKLGIGAVTGPWQVTTGAGATVLAIGLFT